MSQTRPALGLPVRTAEKRPGVVEKGSMMVNILIYNRHIWQSHESCLGVEMIPASAKSKRVSQDSVVLEKLKQIEDRLQSKHANRSDAQREAHEAQQAQRLRQLVLEAWCAV